MDSTTRYGKKKKKKKKKATFHSWTLTSTEKQTAP
jgi:hypothetical protein